MGELLLPCGLPLRWFTVCASVSILGQMPSSLPCLSPVCRLSVTRSVSLSLSLPPCVCVYVCVCVCVCDCVHVSLSVCLYLPLTVFECVSEPSSLSASVSPDSQPPIRSFLWPWPLTGAMALAEELAPAAVSLRVGACECLCVCPCACLWLICSLRKVVCLVGGVGARGPW